MSRQVELPEYLGMVRRVLRAAGARCADADPEDLAQLLTIGRELDAAIQAAVDGMRGQHGFSWTDVGRAAGMTRQAAQQRWGTKADPSPASPEDVMRANLFGLLSDAAGRLGLDFPPAGGE